MWKNTVQPDRPQMTVWGLRFACWIPKAINTHSQYSTHCFSTATMVARTLLNVTLYVNCLSCYTPDWGLVAKRLLFTELPYYVILFSLIRVTGSSHLKPPFPLPAVISLIIFTVECKLWKYSLHGLPCHAVNLNIPDGALATAISGTFRGAFGNVEAN